MEAPEDVWEDEYAGWQRRCVVGMGAVWFRDRSLSGEAGRKSDIYEDSTEPTTRNGLRGGGLG